MNRQHRAQLAGETLSIMETGFYTSPEGGVVSIEKDLAAARVNTKLYQPDDYQPLVQNAESSSDSYATTFQVSPQTTLEAARKLTAIHPSLACLNFASAKNPGGGFLSGSQAREESLARSSGLYAALQIQPTFYEFHRSLKISLYSDHVIFSPQVPVFRDDSGHLLSRPWNCSFLTAAAVNAGAVKQNEPGRVGEILPAMERRTRMVLAVAIEQQCEALVLGAWGCGVFQNDPTVIAATFSKVFAEKPFRDKFRHVEFAIYDPAPEQSTLAAFRKEFPLSN